MDSMSQGHEWYSMEGVVFDRHAGRETDGHPLASAAWLSVLNPSANAEANATLTVYHARRAPAEHHFSVPPGQAMRLALHDLPALGPRNEQYALRLRSDRPVFPQHTWAHYRPFRPIPEDMESITLYPAPLGAAHRRWIFPDMYQGVDDDRVWDEKEVLSLLNPGLADSLVAVTFYDGYWKGDRPDGYRGAPYERQLRVTAPAGRVLTVRLYDHVEVPRQGGGTVNAVGSHRFNMQCALRLECSEPIIPQKTRRCQVQFDDTIIGEWTSIGLAAGEEG